jgi:transcription initiation factor TFIIIB Brf1 subunit/transcription initiation factor TFIIB
MRKVLSKITKNTRFLKKRYQYSTDLEIPQDLRPENLTFIQVVGITQEMKKDFNKEYLSSPKENGIELDNFFAEELELKLTAEDGIKIIQKIMEKLEKDEMVLQKIEELSKLGKLKNKKRKQ